MVDKSRVAKRFQRFFCWLLFGGLAFFLIRFAMYALTIITTPVPVEYREGAMLLNTAFLMRGVNPYDLENHPLAMNVYGFGYNLAVYPFAVFFGNSLVVHRAVSALFILLSCGITIYWIIFRGGSPLFAISGGSLLMASLLFNVTPVARPDALGVFLFLVAIFLPERYYFNRASLIASAFFGVAAFYTKPYFVLSLGIMASFLFLFISKEKGLHYSFGSAFILLAFATLLRISSECYFLDTILHHIALTGRSIQMMVNQIVYFLLVYLPLLLILTNIIADRSWKSYNDSIRVGLKGSFMQKNGTFINLSNLNQPLVSTKANLPWYAFTISTMVFIFTLGQHLNNYIVYLFQLMTPFLLVGIFQYLDKNHNFSFITVPLILVNFYIFNNYVLYSNDPRPYQAEWRRIEELISSSRNIINSPAIAPLLVEMGKPVYDSGETEYYYTMQPYSTTILAPKFELVDERGRDYLDQVNKIIENKNADLVIITENYSPIISLAVLSRQYKHIETIIVGMPQTKQNWKLQLWIPK